MNTGVGSHENGFARGSTDNGFARGSTNNGFARGSNDNSFSRRSTDNGFARGSNDNSFARGANDLPKYSSRLFTSSASSTINDNNIYSSKYSSREVSDQHRTDNYAMRPRSFPSDGLVSSSEVTHTGVVLGTSSQLTLLKRFGTMLPAGWTVLAEHMTICMGPLHAPYNKCVTLGQKVALRVTHFGIHNTAAAVMVSGCLSVNASPHVTLAVAPGSNSVNSNTITTWQEIEDPIDLLEGVIKEVKANESSNAIIYEGGQMRTPSKSTLANTNRPQPSLSSPLSQRSTASSSVVGVYETRWGTFSSAFSSNLTAVLQAISATSSGVPPTEAQRYLDKGNGDVETAIALYYADNPLHAPLQTPKGMGGANGTSGAAGRSSFLSTLRSLDGEEPNNKQPRSIMKRWQQMPEQVIEALPWNRPAKPDKPAAVASNPVSAPVSRPPPVSASRAPKKPAAPRKPIRRYTEEQLRSFRHKGAIPWPSVLRMPELMITDPLAEDNSEWPDQTDGDGILAGEYQGGHGLNWSANDPVALVFNVQDLGKQEPSSGSSNAPAPGLDRAFGAWCDSLLDHTKGDGEKVVGWSDSVAEEDMRQFSRIIGRQQPDSSPRAATDAAATEPLAQDTSKKTRGGHIRYDESMLRSLRWKMLDPLPSVFYCTAVCDIDHWNMSETHPQIHEVVEDGAELILLEDTEKLALDTQEEFGQPRAPKPWEPEAAVQNKEPAAKTWAESVRQARESKEVKQVVKAQDIPISPEVEPPKDKMKSGLEMFLAQRSLQSAPADTAGAKKGHGWGQKGPKWSVGH